MIDLLKLADDLDKAKRQGSKWDNPEGARVIIMTDTLAKEISKGLREWVEYFSDCTNGNVNAVIINDDPGGKYE